LPCVLLLWDCWPLRRIFATRQQFSATATTAEMPTKTPSWLVVEKLPLFALSAASAVITMKAQQAGHAMRLYPRSIRLGNAIVSYASYMKKAFWPMDLSPMYPHPGDSLAKWQVFAAVLFLLASSALIAAEWRRRSYLMVGWLWLLINRSATGKTMSRCGRALCRLRATTG